MFTSIIPDSNINGILIFLFCIDRKFISISLTSEEKLNLPSRTKVESIFIGWFTELGTILYIIDPSSKSVLPFN